MKHSSARDQAAARPERRIAASPVARTDVETAPVGGDADSIDRRSGVGRPRGTGAQIVFERLREHILSLELAPNAELDEMQLVTQFELSRTPVREALIRLSSEGLVELPPNKTPRVASLDFKEVPALLEALELAQRAVNRWAATARDDSDMERIAERHETFREAARARNATAMSDANRSFHQGIAAACRNPWLAQWYGTLLNGSMRLARLMFNTAPLLGEAYLDYYDQVIAEHQGMVDAIGSRDADAAEQVGREHARLFRDQVQGFMVRSRADEIALDR